MLSSWLRQMVGAWRGPKEAIGILNIGFAQAVRNRLWMMPTLQQSIKTSTITSVITKSPLPHNSIKFGVTNYMAKKVELGLTLKGEEAEEFLRNEKSPAFTSKQLAFFREAKRIYKANCSKF